MHWCVVAYSRDLLFAKYCVRTFSKQLSVYDICTSAPSTNAPQTGYLCGSSAIMLKERLHSNLSSFSFSFEERFFRHVLKISFSSVSRVIIASQNTRFCHTRKGSRSTVSLGNTYAEATMQCTRYARYKCF